MSRGAWLAAMGVGTIAIAFLLRALPAEVFAATLSMLLVVASLIFLLVAAAMVLRPARALAQRLFALPLEARGPFLGLPRERDVPVVLRPLGPALVCVLAAMLAAWMR